MFDDIHSFSPQIFVGISDTERARVLIWERDTEWKRGQRKRWRDRKIKEERRRRQKGTECLQGLKLNRPTSLAIFLPPYDEYMYIHTFDLMITSVWCPNDEGREKDMHMWTSILLSYDAGASVNESLNRRGRILANYPTGFVWRPETGKLMIESRVRAESSMTGSSQNCIWQVSKWIDRGVRMVWPLPQRVIVHM